MNDESKIDIPETVEDFDVTTYVDPLSRISKDLMRALRGDGAVISDREARFMVNLYYMMQKNRIVTNNQIKSLHREAVKDGRDPDPNEAISWIFGQSQVLEEQVKKFMGIYTATHKMHWFFEQTFGIGPVLAGGLLAYFDIKRAPTAGHFWSYAGLNPNMVWEKGQKRPFNADVKTLCWKIGDSFVKFSTNDKDHYGKLYRKRKEIEIAKNDAGDFKEQAELKLENFKIGKDTDAYKAYSIGKLPPAHIDMRARRWAVKLFLSHFHQRWHEEEIGPCPRPWVFEHDDKEHTHFLAPPQVKPQS